MKNSTKYLIASTITFITGYIFLRYAYMGESEHPFAQEIILLVLGTIVTMPITAALLNKQSEVELEKEQRVKLFDLKSDLYFELIEFIEKIISKEEINNKDLIALEFLTHKISTVANPQVLNEYSQFIQIIKNTSQDNKISPLESDVLSKGLAKLCFAIRYDLINKENNEQTDVEAIISSNIEKL